MAAKMVVVALALLFAMVVVASGDCPPLIKFQPCVQYVQAPTSPRPSKGGACCTQLADLDEDCLCAAAKSTYPGITIDFQKCLTLPRDCGRFVPPNTFCNGVPVPT